MQQHNHGIVNGTLVMRAASGNRTQIGSGSNAQYANLDTADAGTGDSGNLQPFAVTNYVIKS